MSRRCKECGAPTGPQRRICKQCSVEKNARKPVRKALETEDGRKVGSWIRVDGVWHASIRFDGHEHEFACGEVFDDFPADGAALDHWRVDSDSVCPACRQALEDTAALESEQFSRAGELRADGGQCVDGTERPEDWPETFLDPIVECQHAFTWDTADGCYYCMYCGEQRDEPPERYMDTGTDQDGGLETDGGVEDRRETIIPTSDGVAIGEDAVPMVVRAGGASTTSLGPDPVAFEFLEEQERGQDE